ncbi:MAG: DUF4845 domain-containing protein [Sulfuricellaceae bacterium]|nr:DUF4845 domain-containing protein [Sulfuricellaceae bacterium]
MKKNQLGMTFFGVVFIGGAIIFTAILGMKMVPAYLEFFSVQKILGAMAKDSGFSTMAPIEIRKSFDRRAQIDYVKVIEGKDLEISKSSSGNLAVASYQVVIPIVANVSVLLEFEASTAGTKAAKVVG